MRIKQMLSQTRRDFRAILDCEACGHETELKNGYDDRNYHDNVIPAIPCESCGKSRNDLGIVQPKTQTKYQPWEVV